MEGLFIKNIKKTLLNSNMSQLLFSHAQRCNIYCQNNSLYFTKYNPDIRNGFEGSHNRLLCLRRRYFHVDSVTNFRKRDKEDRRLLLSDAKEQGTDGERSLDLDTSIRGFGDIFPDENTPDIMFDGVRFKDLPIVNVKVSRNNTIISMADAKGNTKLLRSCGIEGFKNTKKGSNVAAQITAQNLGQKALNIGYKNARVTVRGLGPGRVAAMKGLSQSGLNVVSISDVTPIAFYISPRPRKAKKK